MGMFHPDLAPWPKPQQPELNKLTVICHLCGPDGLIGIIDTKTIALPLKGHMFASPAPERGIEPFFHPDADWETMWCKHGIPNPVDGHHPFPPTKLLTKEKGWYEPKGSSELIMCPLCKTDGVDSILEVVPDTPNFAICPIHGERQFLGEPIKQDTTDLKEGFNQCQICGKEHESQKALSGHMKAHRTKKGKEKNHGSKRTSRKAGNLSN